ncbi:MAG: hypothetical protein KH382_07010 [Clostridiales bacterium]|jgi:hypothetical protein|nr:hypothetical protein [Clostridiales bacterium]
MKTKPEYSQFIFDLNNGIILEFAFEVEGYAHYSECRIYLTHEISKLGNILTFINVQLTKDGSESVSFYKKFNESYKLFYMGRKGSYTLKQVWNKIQVHDIVFKTANG